MCNLVSGRIVDHAENWSASVNKLSNRIETFTGSPSIRNMTEPNTKQ